MKKWFLMSVALVCALFTFTACGDDDDNTKPGVQDNGNQLVATYAKDGKTFTMEANFQNDVCVSCYAKVTYPSAEEAKRDYQEGIEEIPMDIRKDDYTLEGNVITVNMSKLFSGMSKDQVKEFFDMIIEELNRRDDNGNNDTPVVNSGITESGNTMTCTISMSGGISEVLEATFQNDRCVSCIARTICPNEEIARMLYEELINDLDEGEEASIYHLNGNTIVVDMTEEFQGRTKDEVRRMFEAMMKEVK